MQTEEEMEMVCSKYRGQYYALWVSCPVGQWLLNVLV